MKSMDDFTCIAVITTIAPNNIDNQRKAVNSWLAVGFKVLSYNCMEEIEILKPYFEDIEFIEAKRDARKVFGKPYVYFIDMMEYLRESPYEVCGIINSDIHLCDMDNRFIDFVCDEVKDSLVFGQRVDVDLTNNEPGKMYIGYDYFFFERKLIDVYPSEKFCIGQPVWDYWIVFIAAINNKRTKRIVNHIAFHEKHKQNWDENTTYMLTDIILNKYMVFLGNKKLSREDRYREYIRYVFHRNEDIYFKIDHKEPSILIIYNDCGINDISKSMTYQSIVNQQYSNFRLIMGTTESVDFRTIPEDAVYFVDEGYIMNKYFLKMMSRNILKSDFSLCGIKVAYPDTLSMYYIYPNLMGDNSSDSPIQSCILYNKEFLKKNGIVNNFDIYSYKAEFVGQGIIELLVNYIQIQYWEGNYNYIIEQFSKYDMPEIQYYVAMSLKHEGDIELSGKYFLKMIDGIDHLHDNSFFLQFQFSFDEITDILIGNTYKIDTNSWQRLYSFCRIRADLRYKLLNALYRYKEYEKILEFGNEDSPEVCFYTGRVYKDLKMYDMAIVCLNRYLQLVKENNERRIKSVLGDNFVISAHYHLGELYYLFNDLEKAKSNFEICVELSVDYHKKAHEYLSILKNSL